MKTLLITGLASFIAGAACEKLFAHRIYTAALNELKAAKAALKSAIDKRLE